MAMVRVKGYVEVSDDQLDPEYESGITPEAYRKIDEQFIGLEDLEIEVVR